MGTGRTAWSTPRRPGAAPKQAAKPRLRLRREGEPRHQTGKAIQWALSAGGAARQAHGGKRWPLTCLWHTSGATPGAY